MKGIHSGRSGSHRAAALHRLRALLSPDPPESRAPAGSADAVDGALPTSPRSSQEPPDPLESAGSPPDGRFDLSLPGARALVAVGLATALAAAGYLWLARPRPEPMPAAEVRAAPAAQPSPVAVPATASAGAVVVHVAGKVRQPGVVTLPAGARVTDAIEAAGGLRPGAKTGVLNLARHVVDGEQIPVGLPVTAAPGAPVGPVAPGGAPGAAVGAAPGTQLDLNTASVEQFDQLPGVGPVLAQRIIDYRTRHGAFRSVDQLQEVNGIGERRYAELKDLVRV